jgi:ferredoxin
MSTAEWRAKYETNGMVDLWLEDEFNAGSRLIVSAPEQGSACGVDGQAGVGVAVGTAADTANVGNALQAC